MGSAGSDDPWARVWNAGMTCHPILGHPGWLHPDRFIKPRAYKQIIMFPGGVGVGIRGKTKISWWRTVPTATLGPDRVFLPRITPERKKKKGLRDETTILELLIGDTSL